MISIPHSLQLVPVLMATREYYQKMCFELKRTLAACVLQNFIERDSFVENVRTITLFHPILITMDVSNVKLTGMDGLSS